MASWRHSSLKEIHLVPRKRRNFNQPVAQISVAGGALSMALTFPNQSRSFDAGKQSIRFSGYDGVFEVSVFVDVAVLRTVSKERFSNEAQYLAAFDDMRAVIERSTLKTYSRKPRATVVLTATDVK